MSRHNGNSSTSQQQQPQLVVLLLDLDCFYAQCECVHLGFNARMTLLVLLQWNSILAVMYPAHELYSIQCGDSWEDVQKKSSAAAIPAALPSLTYPLEEGEKGIPSAANSDKNQVGEEEESMKHPSKADARMAATTNVYQKDSSDEFNVS